MAWPVGLPRPSRRRQPRGRSQGGHLPILLGRVRSRLRGHLDPAALALCDVRVVPLGIPAVVPRRRLPLDVHRRWRFFSDRRIHRAVRRSVAIRIPERGGADDDAPGPSSPSKRSSAMPATVSPATVATVVAPTVSTAAPTVRAATMPTTTAAVPAASVAAAVPTPAPGITRRCAPGEQDGQDQKSDRDQPRPNLHCPHPSPRDHAFAVQAGPASVMVTRA